MTSTTPTRPPVGPDAPGERNTVMLVVVGVLASLSVVIAALVIFSSGGAPAEKPDSTAAVRADGPALVVGPSSAPAKVVVHEGFGSPDSRAFEIGSRDFLRIEAGRGVVQVEYRPFPSGASTYDTDAMRLWAAALSTGTPRQALAVHDLLFDRQPADDVSSPTPAQLASWAKERGLDEGKVVSAMGSSAEDLAAASRAAADAGARRTPLVILDGKRLRAGSPTELADELQRRVLQEDERSHSAD